MAFEMSLPHAPRVQAVGPDGTETLAQDEQQWDLYFTVQRALAAQQEASDAQGGEGQEATAEEASAGQAQEQQVAAPKGPQPSDPQKVLEKLMTARGELDVITDLITFVEQQQFLAVAGVHRNAPTLEERVRARCLRLAASKQQLRRAAERLGSGAAALRAQEGVESRFLADLAALRQRWRLRRHTSGAGTAGMFYADISLPLRGAAAEGISQEGAQCSIIQDTNGDACIVEASAPAAAGGKRRAVRGWQHIHSVLEAKQQLLTWQVLRQLVAAQARQQQYEADPDGAVAAVQSMVGAALDGCQAAVYAAVLANPGEGRSAAGASAMEVDGGEVPGGGGSSRQQHGGTQGPGEAAAAAAAAAGGAPAAGMQPGWGGGSGGSGGNGFMLSSAARDIQAALSVPGFQQQFEARALLLLSRLLAGSASGSGTAAAAAATAGVGAGGPQRALMEALLRWLRHTALCHRAGSALRSWSSAAPGRALRHIDSGEEFTVVWQLLGSRAAGAAPVLVIAVEDCLRLEGGSSRGPAGSAGVAAAGGPQALQCQRGLTRAEFERALQAL